MQREYKSVYSHVFAVIKDQRLNPIWDSSHISRDPPTKDENYTAVDFNIEWHKIVKKHHKAVANFATLGYCIGDKRGHGGGTALSIIWD